MSMSRAFLVLLVVLQILPAVGQEPAPEGEIRGRVTDRETGQPLPGARVRLHRRDGPERWSTTTDEAGRYLFTGLTAGEYTGIVDTGPFRPTHATGSLPAGTGRSIVLKDGEAREFDVALARTYAIDVRVLDEWGDPLSGLRVGASSAGSGWPASPVWSHRSTDDHGRQRVFGLQPGRYVVCAESGFAGQSVGGRGDALLRTCYPSTTDEAEAQVVRVGPADVSGIEIRMRRGHTFTIAGRIMDASGEPASGARLVLSQYRLGGSTGMSHGLDAEGGFRFTNVHPGEYAIEAWIGGPDQPEQRRPLERAFVPIRVDAADLTDVSVTLQKTVDVIGRVTVEDPTASFVRGPGPPIGVMSRLAEDAVRGSGSLSHALVDDERSFTMKNLFGRRTLDVVNLPRGWYVRSIRYAGRDIIDEPTTFKDSGGEPTVEVLLSNRGAAVVGRATDETGNAAAGAMVIMFPADSARRSWKWPTATRASRAGQFRAGPVRAGEYFIVALPASVHPIQPGDSARLARLAAVAERITLGELDERTVDVRIVAER